MSAQESSFEVSVDGRPALQSSGVEWVAHAGIEPMEITLDFPEQIAKSLLAAAGGASRTIRIARPDGLIELKHMTALKLVPPPMPEIGRLVFADRRWLWGYRHVVRTFNLRQRTGVKRLVAGRIEINPIDEEIDFAPWSLNNGVRWTAKAVLEWLLGEIVDADRTQIASLPGFRLELNADELRDVPIENLELDDTHGEALMRVLAHLPELAVTVDRDGGIRVFTRLGHGADRVTRNLPPPLVSGGIVVQDSDWSVLRPREIEVLFDREIETRVDFLEPHGLTNARPDPEGLFVENVVPVPDHTLTVNGKTVAEGTWITVDEALAAWGVAPHINVPLTQERLHVAFAPFVDLWTGLALAGERDPNAEWMQRVSALQQHYRRTFRINPRVRARVRDIRAYRVGTLNTETGTRSPASVYSDYCYLASQRSIRRDLRAGVDAVYVMNVAGHATGADLENSLIAPATVQVIDADQGIFQVAFDQAPVRVYDSVFPGQIQYGTGGVAGTPVGAANVGPTLNLRDRSRPLCFDAVVDDFGNPARLVAGHAMAVVLTVVPATDGPSAIHKVTVQHSDVIGVASPLLSRMIARSRGPTMQIRIPPSIEQARVAWADHARSRIERALGIRDTEAPEHLDDLTVNLDSSAHGAVGASLTAIAKAAALRAWATFADRTEGSQAMPFNPSVRFSGWMDQVRYSLLQGGGGMTSVEMVQRIPEFHLFSLLDDGQRRVVGRLVDR